MEVEPGMKTIDAIITVMAVVGLTGIACGEQPTPYTVSPRNASADLDACAVHTGTTTRRFGRRYRGDNASG